MNLTRRQLELLVYLANTNLWLTSEKLAEQIHTTKKTVQAEIKDMLDSHPEEIQIESNKRKGYHLVYLAPELQTQIVMEVKKHKMYSSMNFRASTMIIYLIFQEEYVSMQQLADTFFLSKTAVSNEVKTIQRWVNRNPNLELEVSNQKGLKIHVTEDMRRIFASMVGTQSVLLESRLPADFIEEVLALIPLIQNFLQEILIEANYIISGEDFLRYARYLALTIARGRRQYSLEVFPVNTLLVPVVEKIVAAIATECGYQVTVDEHRALGNRLLELNYLFLDNQENLVIAQKLLKFEGAIIDFLALPTEKLFVRSDALVMHIQQMELRMTAGHNVLNHFAQKTLANYPLEAYLVRRFFPIYFDLRPNLAELSYLVLYLAESLESYRSGETLLVVSNQSFSILNALKRNLEDALQRKVRQVQIEPVYLFEARLKEQQQFSLALTTEQEIVFNYPGFNFIPSVLTENELNELSNELYQQINEKEEAFKQDFLAKYYNQESQIVVKKKVADLQQLVPATKDLITLPITAKVLFACEIKDSGTTQIRQYQLQEAIVYQQRKIQTIIHVSYVKNSLMLPEFSAISELLSDL
ncbi:helix-turn-helix domain-containing protein [Enterococcus sp. LJL90]